MNICITNHDMQPQFIGGIKRVISILTNEWCRDCSITIISFAPQDTRYEIFGNVAQYIFPNPNNILSRKNHEFFSNVIEKEHIDIILHPYTLTSEINQLCYNIKELTGVKLISALHFAITYNSDILKSYFFNKYRIGKKPIAWIREAMLYIKYQLVTKRKVKKQYANTYNYIINNSDKVVVLSSSHIDALKQVCKNENIDNVLYINNPAIIANSPTLINKQKKILWCGRLEYSTKRTDRIMDIWKDIAPKYPEWELIIMGSGNVESFKQLADKMHISNIKFTGSCVPTEYYKKGDILCMTSSTEGWGMVLIEGMQYGCVPIAYNSFSSLTDIIENNKNGFTVTPFNKQEYIEKLETLMNDTELRERFAQNGCESIKRFDHKLIAKQWIDLFKEVLS